MSQLLVGEHIPARPAPLPKRLRLSSARDVRRELHRIYSLLMSGEIGDDTCRTATFVLRTLLESVRVDEVERRLALLEKSTQEDDNE